MPSLSRYTSPVQATKTRGRYASSSKYPSRKLPPPTCPKVAEFESSPSNFPPVSATEKYKPPTSNRSSPDVDDLSSANKSMVERIHIALEFDEDKYQALKFISSEFYEGATDTAEYLTYVQQFGLTHLVPEMAILFPDASKHKELADTYNARSGMSPSNERHCSRKIRRGMRQMQDTKEDRGDALSNGRHCAFKKKSNITVDEGCSESCFSVRSLNLPSQSTGRGSNQSSSAGKAQKKKTSKFPEARWGDGSLAKFSDIKRSDSGETSNFDAHTSGGLPVYGVWGNGGGRRLVETFNFKANTCGGLPQYDAWRNGGGQRLLARTRGANGLKNFL
ncbi:unnamed protein product [Ilex paraguariensis]|uniref:ZNF598/HEL2 PAH domain-containing protein n=1 Tax=Ilex paraguariensis TaxID=185542 RepID=A0ABC8V2J1_9AQUA